MALEKLKVRFLVILNKIKLNRMKNLKNYIKDYINESIWDIEDNIEDDNQEFHLTEVKKFLEDNYEHININRCEFVFDKKRKKHIVNCVQQVNLKHSAKQLTNDLFEWGVVKDDFSCYDCSEITSLEGAPKEVNGSFDCSRCESLESLNGAPETVKEWFDCSGCSELTSLKGAPKVVKQDFCCGNCPKLSSLDGIGKVGGIIVSDIK